MNRNDASQPYEEFNGAESDKQSDLQQGIFEDLDPDEPNGPPSLDDDSAENASPLRFSRACLKNVFTVVLILIYLLLTTVAAFLAYQTISDFLEKLTHPVMSVTYKEVDIFSAPGIALYPGKAQLLSCRHYYHDYIPPLVKPGTPEARDCTIENVSYVGPFTNQTQKRALVVRGPTDVRNKEMVFMQFSLTDADEDFSAITYMLFAKFRDLTGRPAFMMDCEKNYSMWTFSGGFRTWVKMSLVMTSGRTHDSVEFRQEAGVVKYNDKRSNATDELFFVVFEWRDPFIQEIRLIVTANPWNSVAILCGVFMALFKAANFAKLSISWMIKMRKRHLRNRDRELRGVT